MQQSQERLHRMQEVTVLGIGNNLLADEGVGVHAIQRLAAQSLGEHVRLIDGGTLSFTLAEAIAATDRLIVIDAARFDSQPGTVRLFEGEAMDAFLAGPGRRSVHEVGLIDLMQMARMTGDLPRHRALIGVEPESVDWGSAPTPAVAASLGEVCDLAQQLIQRWQS